MFPAKDADKEEDRRDEPGQDDHHDHLIMMARLEMNMNINMNMKYSREHEYEHEHEHKMFLQNMWK